MRKLKNREKLAALCVFLMVTAPILLLVFILLPIYALVGDTTKTPEQKDEILHRASLFVQGISVIGAIGSVIVIWYVIRLLMGPSDSAEQKNKNDK